MVKEVPGEILVQRLNEYIKLWQKYMEMFNQGLESETIDPETEKEFRKLCVELTQRAQFLRIAMPEGIFDLWKDVRKLIGETPSLAILKKEVPIRISAFKSMWHEVTISINQKSGQLRNVLEAREHGKGKKKH
ncbi:MAG: hypothetical protein GC154_21125 [bacterium]|nr:hypothetical protein [bacterium]